MEGSYKDKYSFVGEWYDSQASLNRRFNVFYYPTDNTLEMYDIKRRKTFVRRTLVNGIDIDSFYIGCTLNIFGRLIKIVDFGCEDTKRRLQENMQVTCALIKPQSETIIGKILTHFHEHGLRVTRLKKVLMSTEDISFIYRYMHDDLTYPFQIEHMTGRYLYAAEVLGKNVVKLIKSALGARNPMNAAPGTIRQLYGLDTVRNCVHTSRDLETAAADLEFFFPPPPFSNSRFPLTATLSNCTLCILKPHAVREGKLGAALQCIDEGGFDITALNMLVVETMNAAEFCEVYKGIVQEYKGMVEELASGPCVAMEIVCKDKTLNTAIEFRKLVGPVDPEIARLLRPHTLRAKLGNTKVQNAIHCSDLPEDGLLEVEYFFKILDM